MMRTSFAFPLQQPLRNLVLMLALICAIAAMVVGGRTQAASGEKPVERDYSRVTAAPAPAQQTLEAMMGKSECCG